MIGNGINKIMLMCLILISLGTSRADAHAIDENFDFSLESAIANRNVWRGSRLSGNVVYQSSMALSTHGVTLSLWGNLETTGPQWNCFSEVNFTAEYTHQFEWFDLSAGIIFYDYPEKLSVTPPGYYTAHSMLRPECEDYAGYDRPSTYEVYLSFLVNCYLSPKITLYRDLDEHCGWYLNIGVSHTYENIQLDDDKMINIDIVSSIGWGSDDHNYGTYFSRKSGFTDAFVGIDLPIIFGSHLVFTPSFGASTLLCKDIKAAQGYSVTYLTGMSASWTF